MRQFNVVEADLWDRQVHRGDHCREFDVGCADGPCGRGTRYYVRNTVQRRKGGWELGITNVRAGASDFVGLFETGSRWFLCLWFRGSWILL